MVQHRYSEHLQLTDYKNKHAAVAGNELYTYYHSRCARRDFIFLMCELLSAHYLLAEQ
jgi:hypothetical protein